MYEVVYFSGTGNSYYLAKIVAENLKSNYRNVFLDYKKNKVEIKVNHLIIICPMHHHGVPRYIKKWIEKLKNTSDLVIDFIVTYGFNIGKTKQDIERILTKQNLQLNNFYSVRMPYNYVIPSKVFKMFSSFKLKEYPEDELKEVLRVSELIVKQIIDNIKNSAVNNKQNTKQKVSKNEPFLHNSLHKSAWLKITGYKGEKIKTFDDAISKMDYAFIVDSNCNGCSTCTKLCPVNNIKMANNKPLWEHNCEQCFACLQWCPQQAIQFRGNTKNQNRYHHHKVKISEMIYKN